MTQPARPSSAARKWRTSLLGASLSLLVVACDNDPVESAATDEPVALGEVSIQLTRAETCDDLLTSIQEGAVTELSLVVQRIREAGEDGFYGGVGLNDRVSIGQGDFSVESDSAVGTTSGGFDGEQSGEPAFVTPNARVNSGDNSNFNEEGEGLSAGRDPNGGFSGTTVQVVDVDEADIVKTDGDRMYVLHGGTLLVVNAWPADATSLIAQAQIEGEPTEMFVYEGKAIVFSRVYQNLIAAAEGASYVESRYYDEYGSTYTKITVLDVSGDTDTLGVVRESYIEGNYNSARRHDGLVRAIIQDGYKVPSLGDPNIDFRDPFGEPYAQAEIDQQLDTWAERTARAIRATDLGNWLPREFELESGKLSAVPPRCDDYYRPDTGLTESGVTSVVALDLDDPNASLGGATILGRAERVYANRDVLIVTQTDYRYQWNEQPPSEQTILHRFDIDGPQTGYTASGTVVGRIHNQFSLDERNGIIRVSTTEERRQRVEGGSIGISSSSGMGMGGAASSLPVQDSAAVARPSGEGMALELPPDNPEPTEPAEEMLPLSSPGLDEPLVSGGPFISVPAPENGLINRVVTFETNGSQLVQLGSTEQFGATERIYATRFMGDRAYVVTFRRTDPLFVLDMSDDSDPKVVGELIIPGFSDYLYPIGANHLFAVGQDANEEGRVRGLALQLFDVSDATRPLLIDRHIYADNGSSPANVDHRAISFHNDGTKVAFPLRNYQTNERTLEVFSVTTDQGISPLGSVNSTDDLDIFECLRSVNYSEEYIQELQEEIALNPGFEDELFWECNYNREFRRAIFRDNVVFGVSTQGFYSYDLDALDAGALSSLEFPAQVYNYGNYDNETAPKPASGGSAPSSGTPVMNMTDPVDAADGGEGDASEEDDTAEE